MYVAPLNRLETWRHAVVYPEKRSRGIPRPDQTGPCRASQRQRRSLLGVSGGMLARKFLKEKVHFPANLGTGWGIFWTEKEVSFI